MFLVPMVTPEYRVTDINLVDQVSIKIGVEDLDCYSMGIGSMIDILIWDTIIYASGIFSPAEDISHHYI